MYAKIQGVCTRFHPFSSHVDMQQMRPQARKIWQQLIQQISSSSIVYKNECVTEMRETYKGQWEGVFLN